MRIANMPRYRLLEQHYSEEDKLLEGDNTLGEGQGTVVGDGSPHKWTGPPTPAMEGLDAASKALVEKEKLRGHGLNPVDYLPIVVDKAVIGE